MTEKSEKERTSKQTKKMLNFKVIMAMFYVLIVGMLIIVIAGFIPISHSYLKRNTLDLFRRAAIDSCAVGKVSLTLFRGVSITDLLLIKKINSKKSARILIPKVRIDYRLFRTVSQWDKCKSVSRNRFDRKAYKKTSFRSAKIDKKKKYKEHPLSSLYSEISGADTLLFSCIKLIAFNRIKVSIDSLGEEIVNVEGISGSIHIKKTDPSCLKIKLSAEELNVYRIQVLRPRMTIRLDGPHCVIKKIACTSFGGKIKGEFDLDLLEDRINSGRFDLKDADLENIFALQKMREGTLSGKCSFMMTFDTSIAEINLLKGNGNIMMTNFSANNLPLLTKLAILTELSSLSYMTFEEVKGDFVVKNGKIQSDNLEANGDPLSLNIAGWVKPDSGYYNFTMKGIFEPHFKDSVSAIVWNAFLPEEDGRRSFLCTVYGTPDSPNISLDKSFVRHAVGSVFKAIGQGIKSLFRRK